MINEEESYMDIYSPPGTKVRFAANGGWEYDKEKQRKGSVRRKSFPDEE